MRRTFLFLAFLATIFSWSVVQAAPFHLMDSSFHVMGGPLAYECRFESCEGTVAIQERYDLSSSEPVADELNFRGSYIRSAASYSGVYEQAEWSPIVDGVWFEQSTGSLIAESILDFRPSFSGTGPAINFSGDCIGVCDICTVGEVTLLDTTSSTTLLHMGFFAPMHPGLSDWTPTFTYDAWNSAHDYRLGMTIAVADHAIPSSFCEITTDIALSSVPEPSTLLLLGSGLAGLGAMAWRRRG